MPQPEFPRPESDECAPYYSTYVDRVLPGDILSILEAQAKETLAFLGRVSEEESLRRYESAKWSIRQVLNHLNDTERLFLFRAFWFARGFDSPLPSFEQEIAVAAARADDLSWARHVGEFKEVRASSVAFFRNLPDDAWSRRGIASGNPFSVRALAYIAVGHVAHHLAILEERYLK